MRKPGPEPSSAYPNFEAALAAAPVGCPDAGVVEASPCHPPHERPWARGDPVRFDCKRHRAAAFSTLVPVARRPADALCAPIGFIFCHGDNGFSHRLLAYTMRGWKVFKGIGMHWAEWASLLNRSKTGGHNDIGMARALDGCPGSWMRTLCRSANILANSL